MDKRKTVYVLIGPKGSGKTFIGRLLEKKVGINFLSVDELGLQKSSESKLTGNDRIVESFQQEEAALEEILQSRHAVSFESTGAHPYLREVLIRLKAKYDVKLVRVYAPLEICYERCLERDQSVQLPLTNSQLIEINENAAKATFSWDLEVNNAAKLSEDNIIDIFKILF